MSRCAACHAVQPVAHNTDLIPLQSVSEARYPCQQSGIERAPCRWLQSTEGPCALISLSFILLMCSSWRCRSTHHSSHGSNAVLRARCHGKHILVRVPRLVVHKGVPRGFNTFQIFTWGCVDPLYPFWVLAPLCHLPIHQQYRSQHKELPKVLVVLRYADL